MNEAADADCDAARSEFPAKLGDGRGDFWHLDRRRLDVSDRPQSRARLAIEASEELIEQPQGDELPSVRAGAQRLNEGVPNRARQTSEQTDVAAVRDDVERQTATSGIARDARCHGDGPRAGEGPVRDEAIDVELADSFAGMRYPARGVERANGPLANTLACARPAEGSARTRRDDGDDVSAALERTRVGSNEVARRVLLVRGPARCDDADAHDDVSPVAPTRDLRQRTTSRARDGTEGRVSAERGTVVLAGRILYLTADDALLRAQLAGEDLPYDPRRRLLDNVSTDEMAPGWASYHYDETLGRYALVGLRGGSVRTDAIRDGGFSVIVAGASMGCGSSRETAPYSQVAAGVRLVIATHFEKIYRQNAQNIGLLTSTDMGLIPRIMKREPLSLDQFTRGLDPVSAEIVERGGLFAYSKARIAGVARAPDVTTKPRPMTLCEKILAAHVVVDQGGSVGVPAVAPGDSLFVRTDVRFSHEYVTPMADALFRAGFGAEARVESPEHVYAFRDHLTLVDRVMSQAHRDMGLDAQTRRLATVQRDFAANWGIKLYGEVIEEGQVVGSEAICHNKVIEDIALPGQVVAGTDSHTCMAGALGCFAFGVGSTDMANAWKTRDVRVRVPETVRVVLEGALGPGVCAKDVMLHLLSQPFFASGQPIGRVLEFSGPGAFGLPLDERATLTNMAVEAGGFTGLIEADEAVVAALVRRGLRADDVRSRIVRGDVDAEYAATITLDLATVRAMVATPGDPHNGVALRDLDGEVSIQIAYGGSCTGGKKTDMDMYARVLGSALARGKRVAPGVQLFLQFGSQEIRRYADERGYGRVFEAVGAQMLAPSCGACINAGPGASRSAEQVTVSAQNRNFPGRSGPGKVYLASPFVVAASAVAGRLASPDEI